MAFSRNGAQGADRSRDAALLATAARARSGQDMISRNAGRGGNAGSSSTDVSDTCGPGGHATSPGGKRH
jgi:hypothetical protein